VGRLPGRGGIGSIDRVPEPSEKDGSAAEIQADDALDDVGAFGRWSARMASSTLVSMASASVVAAVT
jgi:hypothetical protein